MGCGAMRTSCFDSHRPDLVKRACTRLFPKVVRRAREDAALGVQAIWIEGV